MVASVSKVKRMAEDLSRGSEQGLFRIATDWFMITDVAERSNACAISKLKSHEEYDGQEEEIDCP